jgi:hypothetical protein
MTRLTAHDTKNHFVMSGASRRHFVILELKMTK